MVFEDRLAGIASILQGHERRELECRLLHVMDTEEFPHQVNQLKSIDSYWWVGFAELIPLVSEPGYQGLVCLGVLACRVFRHSGDYLRVK